MKERNFNAMKRRKVIISGGGTGGHIFPALSIANALKKIDPSIEILFVGAEGRMEMEKVPLAGYEIVGLPVFGFDRRHLFKNIKVLFNLGKSLKQAKKIIDRFEPDVVVGVGGYASGPVLKVAGKRGIPTLLQEQNSYAGVTNKLLAAKASTICVAYDGMERFFPAEKIVKLGNPVRQNFDNLKELRQEALHHFGLTNEMPVVLVVGGSLGAGTINRSLSADIEKMINSSKCQWLWQTGKYYFDNVKEVVSPYHSERISIHDFINRMDYAFAAADVIVSRAGAGTISELCLVGKPVILIPSPNVAEDHQTKNALALSSQEAAIMIPDAEADKRIVDEAINLIHDAERRETLSRNIKRLGERDADVKIAMEVMKLIDRKDG